MKTICDTCNTETLLLKFCGYCGEALKSEANSIESHQETHGDNSPAAQVIGHGGSITQHIKNVTVKPKSEGKDTTVTYSKHVGEVASRWFLVFLPGCISLPGVLWVLLQFTGSTASIISLFSDGDNDLIRVLTRFIFLLVGAASLGLGAIALITRVVLAGGSRVYVL